jgi:hypothetical protein
MLGHASDVPNNVGHANADRVLSDLERRFRIVPTRRFRVRQPICKLPRALEQRLEKLPALLVRIAGKGNGADMIRPRLEVCLFGWRTGAGPRHDGLRDFDEGQQRLAATHAD